MTALSPVLRERWRHGVSQTPGPPQHVGPAKPTQIVRIVRGLIDRHYAPFTFLDGSTEDFGEILGSQFGATPWHGFWRFTGDWIDVPNVAHVEVDKTFEDNGIVTCTIDIENIIYKAFTGLVGMFHLIKRGYLAPLQGYAQPNRPTSPEATNEWLDVLNGGYMVKVWQGYGDQFTPVFCGLIDETDTKVTPDAITITCRSFGELLTDQRVFGQNKAKEIKSPITFAPRNATFKERPQSGGAVASTYDPGNPAIAVTRSDSSYWLSHGHTTPGNTEWVEIHVPKGTYEQIYVDPHYDGMEMFLSIYVRNGKVNGAAVPDGWIFRGLGNVPGVNGGYPYVNHWPRVASEGHRRPIGFKLECGNNTVIRIAFRNLGFSPTKRDYRAGCRRLIAYSRTEVQAAGKQHWIVVDDAADIVKWALMWAGFHEWEVESLGVNIKEPKVFHQSDYLIDIVKWVEDQADYVFFMQPPTEAEDSLGVPTFRRTRALQPPGVFQEEVRETDLLTEIETKFTKEPLAYIIYVRGTSDKKLALKRDPDATLKTLGESDKSVVAAYFPPWSGAHHNPVTGEYAPVPNMDRLAGLRKHVIHSDKLLESDVECMMAAILIAIKEALASYTGIITIPGHPGIELDDQVSIIDTASGTNTRMWVASVQSTFTAGEQAEYTTTLGGPLVDTPDLLLVALDYFTLLGAVKHAE